MLMQLPCAVDILVRLCLEHLCGAGKLFLLNRRITAALDLPDTVHFPASRQSKRPSRLTGSSRPADAVHIIFNILRYIIVNDSFHIIDVDSARRHIGRDQNVRAAVAKTVHCHVTLMLGHIAVKPLRHKASLFQDLRKLVHLRFRIAEDQAKLRLVIFQQPDARRVLILPADPVIALRHKRDCQLLCRYPHKPCVLLEAARNVQYRLRHRRRKKGGLVFSRNLPENQLHILAEAHIQHFIRLVQHDRVHVVQLDRMTTHMVHHPSGGSHNDLHAAQPCDLPADLLSTVNGKHLDAVHILRHFAKLLRRLDRQLPCRTKNDRLKLAQLRIGLLQNRYSERRRLSRAGLRLPDNILSRQQKRDRLLLNRGERLKAHLLYRTHDPLIQHIKIFYLTHTFSYLSVSRTYAFK